MLPNFGSQVLACALIFRKGFLFTEGGGLYVGQQRAPALLNVTDRGKLNPLMIVSIKFAGHW